MDYNDDAQIKDLREILQSVDRDIRVICKSVFHHNSPDQEEITLIIASKEHVIIRHHYMVNPEHKFGNNVRTKIIPEMVDRITSQVLIAGIVYLKKFRTVGTELGMMKAEEEDIKLETYGI